MHTRGVLIWKFWLLLISDIFMPIFNSRSYTCYEFTLHVYNAKAQLRSVKTLKKLFSKLLNSSMLLVARSIKINIEEFPDANF